jgi:hypothetical protein
MNVDRIVFWFTVCAALVGCAMPPAREPVEPRSYQLAGGVTTHFMPLEEVNRECERRMNNGKTHWGCASYDRARDTCEILVQPVRHKLDWDRAAILGIELNNCNRMRAGEPD